MIKAIAQLGKASRESGELGNELKALVDLSRAKRVLALRIRVSKKQLTYEGLELEENKGEERYLYRYDPTGTPGLFITGRIPVLGDVGVQKLQRSLMDLANKEASAKSREMAKRTIAYFEKKKIVGITRGKGIRQTRNKLLDRVCEIIRNNSKRIMKDVCRTIEDMEPEELLLTVKMVVDSSEKYLGDIPEFVDLFKSVVTQVKSIRNRRLARETSGAKCINFSVCNKEAVSDEFEERPLPFFFIDKPSFIPDGDFDKAYKVFPLCLDCFLDLRHGQKFIENYLNFSISSIESRQAEVRFWLIPVLDNPEYSIDYVKDIGKAMAKREGEGTPRFLYLKNLMDMCSAMGTVTELASDRAGEAAEAFLTFTALFYTKDRQGHMRLISRSEGIYPKRLRFIADVKRRVDSLYPFEKVEVRFGFPLLREFLVAPKSEEWYKELAFILGDIFTGESLNKALLYKAVANKIQERAKEEADLKMIADTSFKALSLIQYIEHLEPSQKEEERLMSSQEVQRAENPRGIEEVKNFLGAHSTLLRDGTLRAICSTGIATGILLEVQRETRRSMPFWGRLNRLEMDLERVKQLFPQILNKLHEYGFHAYDDVLAYLGSHEISNLDLGRKDLSKELISLVFAIGMSQGYFIVHEKGE